MTGVTWPPAGALFGSFGYRYADAELPTHFE
jgi:hypothetical protein